MQATASFIVWLAELKEHELYFVIAQKHQGSCAIEAPPKTRHINSPLRFQAARVSESFWFFFFFSFQELRSLHDWEILLAAVHGKLDT